MSKASSRATTRTTLELELSHGPYPDASRRWPCCPAPRPCWGRKLLGAALRWVVIITQTLRLEVDQTPSPTS
jgi:hypothetical protein